MNESNSNDSIAEQKHRLRQEAKAWRRQLSKSDVLHMSRKISEELETLDFSDIRTICAYNAIERLSEIDPQMFVSWLKAYHPEIKIDFVPQRDDQKFIDDSISYDLILIPLLMCDKQKYRLGYGSGFYDKFLASQPQALKIGLGYKQLQVQNLPLEAHDVRLTRLCLV